MKRKSKVQKVKIGSPYAPLLLIGWGREGAKDIKAARVDFPYDPGLDCVDAQGADSEDVLQEIARWLENNPNAQFLYVGSHGGKNGLFPKSRTNTQITWAKLGSILSKAKAPITVALGACSSQHAAEHWNGKRALRVNLILGFSGETRTNKLKEFLKMLVTMNSVSSSEPSGEVWNITSLPENIEELREAFPGITMHYKVKGYGYVDCDRFLETIGMEFPDHLDRKSNNAKLPKLFREALSNLSPGQPTDKKSKGYTSERLVVRKLKKKQQRRPKR